MWNTVEKGEGEIDVDRLGAFQEPMNLPGISSVVLSLFLFLCPLQGSGIMVADQ